MKKRIFISILIIFLPWYFRRKLLNILFGYNISPKSKIGLSIVVPRKLTLGPGSSIGSLNMCKGLDEIFMSENSSIGNMNWISGFSANDPNVPFFRNQSERKSCLTIGKHSAITNRHLIDCSDAFTIMDFSTLAGAGTQILTHSIDLNLNEQKTNPVTIGNYCFIGTKCVILSGSSIPDYCIVGAMSLINKKLLETHALYGGVPVKMIKKLTDIKYFSRLSGTVY